MCPRRRLPLVTLVVLLLAGTGLAGCLDDDAGAGTDTAGQARVPTQGGDAGQGQGAGAGGAGDGTSSTEADNATDNATDNGTAYGNQTDSGDGNGTTDDGTGGPGNETTGGNDTDDGSGQDQDPILDPIEWGDPEDALVRPGVQLSWRVDGATSFCTSNFVWRSLTNGTVYLGTAAHCVDGLPLGHPTQVYDINRNQAFKGTVAFDAWQAIGFSPSDKPVGDDMHAFDFALIEVPEEHVDDVHPAVMEFGGPTKLGSTTPPALGKRVINFGNSALRPMNSPLDHQEGVVTGNSNDGWTINAYIFSPGIPGDSGSGLMLTDGSAVGALSYVSYLPFPAENGWSSLPKSVSRMKGLGWEIELQTWNLFHNGNLP